MVLFVQARGSHLDLGRAPYVLYGVKYIDLVSLAPCSDLFHAKTEALVRRVAAKRQPKKILICMLYFLDMQPGGSWADGVLSKLGYV